jgi:hypothetical protein
MTVTWSAGAFRGTGALEFRKFLDVIEANVPDDLDVHLVSEPCWGDVCFYEDVGYPQSPIDADHYSVALNQHLDIVVVFAPSRGWPAGSSQTVSFSGGDTADPTLLLQVAATDPGEDVPEAHLNLVPSRHDFGILEPGSSVMSY